MPNKDYAEKEGESASLPEKVKGTAAPAKPRFKPLSTPGVGEADDASFGGFGPVKTPGGPLKDPGSLGSQGGRE